MAKDFQLMVATLQGLTEAVWRSVHLAMFGEQQGDVEYFTPFIRVEKGVVRPRDLRDYTCCPTKSRHGKAKKNRDLLSLQIRF